MSDAESLASLLQNGVALHQAGRLDDARECYRQVLAADQTQAEAWHLMGLLLHQQGHAEQGVRAIEQAVRLNDRNPVYLANLGGVLMSLRRFADAEAVLRRGRELAPQDESVLNNLGVALLEQGRFAQAADLFEQVLAVSPQHARAHMNLGNAFRGLRNPDRALTSYEAALALTPDDADLLANMGGIQLDLEQFDAARTTLQRAVKLNPTCAEAVCNLASLLTRDGDVDQAIALCERALQSNDGLAQVRERLGLLLINTQRHKDAVPVLQRLVNDHSEHVDGWGQLGVALAAAGQLDQAVECYRTVLQHNPRSVFALTNLGDALSLLGRLQEGVDSFRKALEIEPDHAGTLNNLGCTLMMMGRADEALVFNRRAYEISGEASKHDVALLCSQYQQDVTAASLLTAHREWQARHAAGLNPLYTGLPATPPPQRMKLGFVSPDFGNHPVGFFLLGLLQHLNPDAFEIVCYSDRRNADAMTARIRNTAHQWHDVRTLSHETLAEKIHADGIHVLFDLAGHTAHNRLLTFARRPAPVQATWMGYVGTTGLDAMDFVIADRFHIPDGEDDAYVETVYRMPDGYVCYSPPDDIPDVGPLPALEAGHITFGYLGNPCKVTSQVIDVWSRILQQVPDSRLLWKFIGMDDADVRTHFERQFGDHGIESNRIDFEGRSPHREFLAAWNRVDIGLDTFPYSSGLTVLEALLMGVPMVTFPGQTFAGRHATSHQSHVGVTQVIATGLDEYVHTAVKTASDTTSLAELRASLRDTLLSSSLCNYQQFAAAVGDAVHQMWLMKAES